MKEPSNDMGKSRHSNTCSALSIKPETVVIMIMKHSVTSISLTLLMFGASVCYAESDVFNLIGTWAGKTEGAKILLSGKPNPKTDGGHEEFYNFALEYEFTKREGRLFHGTKKSAKITQQVVCAIDPDNKNIYCTDESGIVEGTIASKDKIFAHYHDVTPEESVVSICTLERIK